MASVINESSEDVVYQVDDGPGGGGLGERDARRADHDPEVHDGTSVTGWLSKKSEGNNKAENFEPAGINDLTVSIFRDEKGLSNTEILRAVTYPVKRSAAKCTWDGSTLICE